MSSKVSKIELNKFKELVGTKLFSVLFVKKDGTERKMLCRFGVTSKLQGGELKYSPDKKGYVIVYDVQSKGYRTINVNTLKSFTFQGVNYEL